MTQEDVSNMTTSDVEGLVDRRQELKWVAVDGVLKPVTEVYGRLVNDYLKDEIEDFASAQLNWEASK
jgi:hypothetical protein